MRPSGPSPCAGVGRGRGGRTCRGKPVAAKCVGSGTGEPDYDTPAHIKEAAKKALERGATKYTPVEGTPELRQAAAAWFGRAHGFDVAPSEVMVSAGAKQVIFNAFHALLDEGD